MVFETEADGVTWPLTACDSYVNNTTHRAPTGTLSSTSNFTGGLRKYEVIFCCAAEMQLGYEERLACSNYTRSSSIHSKASNAECAACGLMSSFPRYSTAAGTAPCC